MTYTYKCKTCESEKTVTHGMIEDPTVTCICGEKMQRIITGGAGVIYKTHGFTKRVRLGRSEGK